MTRKYLLAAAAVAAMITACAPADDTPEIDEPAAQPAAVPAANEPPAELEAASDRFTQGWNGEDATAVAAMFTEDARVVEDDSLTFNGRQEIQENWIAEALPILSNLQVQDVMWQPVGQDFRSTGRYTVTVTTPEGESQGSGRYEATWTRDADGQWRINSMTTTNDPAPTPAT